MAAGIAFPNASLAIRVVRRRQVKGKKASTETVLTITDLTWHQIQPWQLTDAIRARWGIENRLHWVRDNTSDEDHTQVRAGRQVRTPLATLVP